MNRVAVLAGGRSYERAISLRSGARVEHALTRLGRDCDVLDADARLGPRLAGGGYGAALVAIHGRDGEDGTVQELLELAAVPYAGPHAAACARAWDKIVAKRAFADAGLPTPRFVPLSADAVGVLGGEALLEAVVERVGLPLVVKPARGGSALGLHRVADADDLADALLGALAYDDRVLCEAHVSGREIGVTVLAGTALPAVEAIASGPAGYDFDARYTPGATEFVAPADVDDDVLRLAERACSVLDCTRFARVDLLVPASGQAQLLELDTVPGLTETSLAPLAARAAGMAFEDLVAVLLAQAEEPR